MIVKPRRGYEGAVRIAEAINPFIVILSIVGLFFEYTPLKTAFVHVNRVLDLLFVADFILRLVCHRPIRYLVRGYGWVDFLASLPGIMLLVSYTPVFAIFKFVRIGRFFKIIRVLRFLRIFNFLKRMKGESPWIQDRVMKIGVAIVLCFVAGIFFMDSGMKAALEEPRAESWRAAYLDHGKDVVRAAAEQPGLLLYREGEVVYAPGGSRAAGGAEKWNALLKDELHWVLELPLPGVGDAALVSTDAVLLSADDLMARHDGLMLILLATLVALLLIVIFYLGSVFAQDMAGVHLIIDSIEAGDLQLLGQEALRAGGGELEVLPDENEMLSLIKVVARLGGSAAGLGGAAAGRDGAAASSDLGLPGFGLAGLGALGGPGGPPMLPGAARLGGAAALEVAESLEGLAARLDRLEERQAQADKRLVVETARIITPAIVRAVRRLLGEASAEAAPGGAAGDDGGG